MCCPSKRSATQRNNIAMLFADAAGGSARAGPSTADEAATARDRPQRPSEVAPKPSSPWLSKPGARMCARTAPRRPCMCARHWHGRLRRRRRSVRPETVGRRVARPIPGPQVVRARVSRRNCNRLRRPAGPRSLGPSGPRRRGRRVPWREHRTRHKLRSFHSRSQQTEVVLDVVPEVRANG